MTKRAIFPLSDKEIVHAFEQLNQLASGTITYSLASGRTVDRKDIAQIVSDTDSFITQATINWNGQVHNSNQSCSIRYLNPETSGIDLFSSAFELMQLGNFQYILGEKTDIIIKSALKLFSVGAYKAERTKKTKNERDNIFSLTNAHLALINRIESGIDKNVSDLRKFIQDSTNEIDRKKKALDAEYKEKSSQLESDYKNKISDFETRETIIKNKLEQIDASDNTTARRKIRSDIIDTISKRNLGFTLSNDTNNKRYWVACLFIFTLIFFVSIFMFNVSIGNTLIIDQNDNFTVVAVKLLRNLVAVGGFFATMFIFIRWQNSWAQRHADAEFAQRQFELDIHRASWAVESALEWNRQSNSAIPTELLNGLTRSLFDGGKASNDDNTALDALASALLGQAQNVRVRQGDNELEFGPKGLKNLAKTPLIKKSAKNDVAEPKED